MTRRLVTEPSGKTMSEEWAEASSESKVRLLRFAGEWRVQPGRLPIEEKVVLIEPKPDISSVMPEIKPLTEEEVQAAMRSR